jgi:hypothetical protein
VGGRSVHRKLSAEVSPMDASMARREDEGTRYAVKGIRKTPEFLECSRTEASVCRR